MVAITYQEQPAPAPLQPWVVAIWQIRGDGESRVSGAHRVLPDGCVDLMFDRNSALLVGPMTRALIAPIFAHTEMLGIRLRAGAVGALSAISARKIQDAAIPLKDAGIRLALTHDQLFERSGLAERAALLMPALASRLAARPARDLAVGAAVESWVRAAGSEPLSTVHAVARHVGLSERSLERRFAVSVGYTPAQFRRLVRFRAALRLSGSAQSWVDIATQCGYSDQAHLTRDFREFASMTPTAWAAEQQPVGFFQDNPVAAR
jgi:AraC-like DNA-binding protein